MKLCYCYVSFERLISLAIESLIDVGCKWLDRRIEVYTDQQIG